MIFHSAANSVKTISNRRRSASIAVNAADKMTVGSDLQASTRGVTRMKKIFWIAAGIVVVAAIASWRFYAPGRADRDCVRQP